MSTEGNTDPDDVPKAAPLNPKSPNADPGLHPNPAPDCSLAASMQSIVDDARQLNTDFGIRPYRVFSVVVRWSGGERGRGDASVESEIEFLPTPKLKDYDSLAGDLRSGGEVERGQIKLTEISANYTEADLFTLFHVKPLTDDREGYVEIRHDGRQGAEPERRRFTLKGAPFHDATNFQWVCMLLAQDQARTKGGAVRDVRLHRF